MNQIPTAIGCGLFKRVVFGFFLLSLSLMAVPMKAQTGGLVISSIANLGSTLVVTGSGGTPGQTYYLLTATNLPASLASWSRVATNTFSANGIFTEEIPVNSSLRQEFVVMAMATPPGSLGLVAAYAFNEGSGTTVFDSSTNGNNGTINGATWTTNGVYGDALVFGGGGDLVTVNNSASLQLNNAMTLEAWVNPSTASSAWRDAIYKGNDNYYLEATSGGGGGPAVGGTFAGVDLSPAIAIDPLPANTWTFLAATYDGMAIRLYTNGGQMVSLPQTGPIAASTNPLQIGGDTIYDQYFQGTIDEVRIYDVALTPAQIQTDMNTPLGNIPTAPGSLTATVASNNEVQLSWTASTGKLGVTGYQIERQGPGSGNFAQIGTTNRTFFNDNIAFVANTNYTYQVRAMDGSGDLGPYSSTVLFTGLSVRPRVAALTVTRTQQFTANFAPVSWSVDGVSGGSAASGTITAQGLYSPPTGAGTHTITATSTNFFESASAIAYVTTYPGTFTYHNNNFRTGANTNETILTPANVNSNSFGKLFSYSIDGISFGSPLYVANVKIPGSGYHNLVFVITEHDSVYAFDADGLTQAPIWQDSFINAAAGVTPVPAADTGETGDIPSEIGITGTPVIDPASGTLYVVAATKEIYGNTTNYVQRLHALNIVNGSEKFGGPVVIQASVPGIGLGTQNGMVSLDPLINNQRPGLLLVSNVVYIGEADHGNGPVYHGWVVGYNATNLEQVMAFCTTPNEGKGGVWQGGGGIAADTSGSLIFTTGNGDFNPVTSDYGDTAVRLDPDGAVSDYFTPFNQAILNSQDLDLSPGGVLLLPDQSGPHAHLMVAAGKFGSIFLINRDNMGGYSSKADTNVLQELSSVLGTPPNDEDTGDRIPMVYFNENVYFSAVSDYIKAYALTNGLLTTTPVSESAALYDYPGAAMAISANGNSNGILWVVDRFGDDSSVSAPGILQAFNPANLTNIYYQSSQAGTRDTLDVAAKFSVPLVANGRVYVASMNRLTAYGLLP